MLVQALLGISAHAPENRLTVDRPRLPDWLGSVEIRDLRDRPLDRGPRLPLRRIGQHRVLAARPARRRPGDDVGVTASANWCTVGPAMPDPLRGRFASVAVGWDTTSVTSVTLACHWLLRPPPRQRCRCRQVSGALVLVTRQACDARPQRVRERDPGSSRARQGYNRCDARCRARARPALRRATRASHRGPQDSCGR